jgi:hypothetical protein
MAAELDEAITGINSKLIVSLSNNNIIIDSLTFRLFDFSILSPFKCRPSLHCGH